MAKRTPNHRLLKIHRSYTVAEVATVLDVHPNSVRNWMRSGLDAIDQRRPILIQGNVLASFLKARRQCRKRPCGRGELYCLRCRSPRPPAGNAVSYIPRTPTSGDIFGICCQCGTRMFKRAAMAKLGLMMGNLKVHLPQGDGDIGSTPQPSLHCDFKRTA